MVFYNIIKFIRKYYKVATLVTGVVIGSYWLGGFFMYLLCMSIVAEIQVSAWFWLIPYFVIALLTFFVTLLLQNKKIHHDFIES